MACNLCLKNVELIKKSHIIPDFFFKDIYDKNHRLIKFDIIKRAKGDKKESRLPTSMYDSKILCKNCDTVVINRYESYFSRNFKTLEFERIENPKSREVNIIKYSGLDYNKMNIFFLTILWKAHISKRPECKEISLRNLLSEKIRIQILSGVYDSTSIQVTAFKIDKNSKFNGLIGQLKKYDDFYSIFIKGFIIFFHYCKNKMYELTKGSSIQSNGNWIISEVPKAYEEKSLISFMKLK